MLRKIILFITILCCLVPLAGCQKKTTAKSAHSAYIEMEELGTDTSSLPYFRVESGELTDALWRLNEIIDDIRESYENALQDENEQYTISSEKTEGTRFLLTTMYITDDWVSLTGRKRQEKNIVTLAYDKRQDMALTATEALESTGITGVQLSQRAEQQLAHLAASDSRYQGNPRSTEMQGFSLDGNGKVDDIYMKLEIDTGKDEPESFFFHFDPADNTMYPLDWPQ